MERAGQERPLGPPALHCGWDSGDYCVRESQGGGRVGSVCTESTVGGWTSAPSRSSRRSAQVLSEKQLDSWHEAVPHLLPSPLSDALRTPHHRVAKEAKKFLNPIGLAYSFFQCAMKGQGAGTRNE
ncbi:uncharacterized protein ACIGJ3_013592 [Trichechus inunguis]